MKHIRTERFRRYYLRLFSASLVVFLLHTPAMAEIKIKPGQL